MEPIRVLQVFTVMNRGGAETMIMNYYRHIDRNRVQFDFLVHREIPGAYEEEIQSLGGRIYRMPPVHPKCFLQYKKVIRAFLQQHKEYKIIHGHFSELGYFLYREAHRQGVPTIICHAHNSSMSLDLKAPFRWYFKHACRKYLTQMYTCSYASSVWLYGKKLAPHTIQMNNAIDIKRFKFDPSIRQEVRRELQLQDTFILGHIGRFNKQKNHEQLIKIFYEVSRQEEKARLLLIGTGELEEKVYMQIKALGIEDKVILLGNRDDVNRLLQAMDVFVFPSLFEGLPVTVIEAQASGIRCIVSDKVPTQTFVTPLVKAIPLTAKDDEWAKEIIQYSKEYVRKDMSAILKVKMFDIEENAKWLEENYIRYYKERT